jgi:rod shape determining protein RodA
MKIIIALTVLFAIGCVSIYSAGHAKGMEGLVYRQSLWFAAGLAVIVVTQFFPMKNLLAVSNALYFVFILLLIAVAFFGSSKMGAKRWIEIGSLQFQPSETGKFFLICVLSRYYSAGRIDWSDKKVFLTGLFLTGIPALMVLKQPDLGTAVIYFIIFLSVIFAAGLPYFFIFNMAVLFTFVFAKTLGYQFFITALIVYALILNKYSKRISTLIILVSCAVLTGFASEMFWNRLKPYQQSRLMTFLDPEKFSTVGGWQIVQSKAAVSNGGLYGRGFLNGSQTQLRFLPEGHNDFIFSVLSEEFGLWGILILLYRLVKIVGRTRNRHLYLTGSGIVALLVVQTAMNIFVTLGILPVTGLTLPFVSYGGTALVINMFMVGVIMSIGKQEKII